MKETIATEAYILDPLLVLSKTHASSKLNIESLKEDGGDQHGQLEILVLLSSHLDLVPWLGNEFYGFVFENQVPCIDPYWS